MLVIMILMSSAFILYTVLGLSPSITEGTADINLLFMRFDIERKELLPYVAYIVLAYTIWKFEVTLDDYAPKRRGLRVRGQLGAVIGTTINNHAKNNGWLNRYIRWLAKSDYAKHEITDIALPNPAVRNKHPLNNEHELRVSEHATLHPNHKLQFGVQVAPKSVFEKQRLDDNDKLAIDHFTLNVSFLGSLPILIFCYLIFVFTSPHFHSLIVTRALYLLAMISAIYQHVTTR